jgi:hypothetical protein
LGTSDFTGLFFDLPSLLDNTIDLSNLIAPFTHVEIDAVVKNLPSNKSPGQTALTHIF